MEKVKVHVKLNMQILMKEGFQIFDITKSLCLIVVCLQFPEFFIYIVDKDSLNEVMETIKE